MANNLRLGTRGSKLALWQAGYVREKLLRAGDFQEIEIKIIKTSGDKDTEKKIDEIGGKGVFIKEIEDALLKGEIDLAVHSSKDMAAESQAGLICPAFLGGVSRQDLLLLRAGEGLQDLPKGAKIGTGSARRIAQLKLLRPDFRFEPIRGNIDTRLRKLEEGSYEAIVLAEAGIERLGIQVKNRYVFSLDEMVPCGGQGIVAVQTRREDAELVGKISKINEAEASFSAAVEFGVLAALGADCKTPVGVFSWREAGSASVAFFLASEDMSRSIRFQETFKASENMIRAVTAKAGQLWRETFHEEMKV